MKFLFFAPFQAIEAHAFPEAFFAETLRTAGHEVVYAGCDGLLGRFCVAHSAQGLTEASTAERREAVCRHCRANRRALEGRVGKFRLLEQGYRPEWEDAIRAAIAGLAPKDVFDFRFRGHPAGQIASYEFILNHKVADFEAITPELFATYLIHLENTLRVLLWAEALFQGERFDRVLLYNAGYSANHVVRSVALRAGIPVAFMHAGPNLRHRFDSMYFSWKTITGFDRHVIDWFAEHYPRIALDRARYPMAIEHFREQLSARSVFTYSAGRTQDVGGLFKRLGVEPRHRKLVLLSMSSTDEAYAADFALLERRYLSGAFRVFGEQADWLRRVIPYFAARPDCKLVIRMHPREYPNKRERVPSAKVREYERIFADLPGNVVIDYPTLGNSIYDLYDVVDLHLVAQSTTGCESAMLGVPGIACATGLGNYPIALINEVPRSEAEYFAALDRELDGPTRHSEAAIRRVLDWYLFLHTVPILAFTTGGFWARSSARGFGTKVLRRLRRALGRPTQSVRRFLDSARMSAEETAVFLGFATGGRELIEQRFGPEPAPALAPASPGVFRAYLVELLSAFYGLDLARYRRFELGDVPDPAPPGTCRFVEAGEELGFEADEARGTCRVRLPANRKAGLALARLIVAQEGRQAACPTS